MARHACDIPRTQVQQLRSVSPFVRPGWEGNALNMISPMTMTPGTDAPSTRPGSQLSGAAPPQQPTRPLSAPIDSLRSKTRATGRPPSAPMMRTEVDVAEPFGSVAGPNRLRYALTASSADAPAPAPSSNMPVMPAPSARGAVTRPQSAPVIRDASHPRFAGQRAPSSAKPERPASASSRVQKRTLKHMWMSKEDFARAGKSEQREEVLRMLYHDRKHVLESRLSQELASASPLEFPVDVRVGRLVGRNEGPRYDAKRLA